MLEQITGQIIVLITVSLVVGIVAAFAFLAASYKKLHDKFDEVSRELEESNEQYVALLHQKKSSEVRLGKIAENMAPFVEDWPWEPNQFRFLGSPIDGINFSLDEITFVEIKSGKSRLSLTQKHIKNLIKMGKVKFATFRVSESGCELKIEEEEDA